MPSSPFSAGADAPPPRRPCAKAAEVVMHPKINTTDHADRVLSMSESNPRRNLEAAWPPVLLRLQARNLTERGRASNVQTGRSVIRMVKHIGCRRTELHRSRFLDPDGLEQRHRNCLRPGPDHRPH